jgi:dTDP-glucose pyrophosphorylase
MKTTLLVLAGGMGSRYGGLKQLDEVGPNGESIVDYSVFDAIRAGFEKVVFIVQQNSADIFRDRYRARLANEVEVECVIQPFEPAIPRLGVVRRTKPWGTAHAVLVARAAIDGPFAVINADDYYGEESFKKMQQQLLTGVTATGYAMVGFTLGNTLSANGSVSRAICETDSSGNLIAIVERTQIIRRGDEIVDQSVNPPVVLSGKELVSMNFWGFDESFPTLVEDRFIQFANDNRDSPTAEFYIPTVVDALIKKGAATVNVLTSSEQWFGLTYAEDKAGTQRALSRLTNAKRYPSPLW